jgi:plastocyanin
MDRDPRVPGVSSWIRWLCGLAACALLPLTAATVTGRIELRDSHEPAVEKRKDYSGVIVYLEPASGVVKASHESRHAVMDQKNKTFKPHVLAIEVGTTVDFPNNDPIFHNAFSTYNGQLFDVGLYPPGTSRSVRFARPGIVRVFCNIHATMSAVILVLNTPYFDTTKSDGRFEVAAVPPGDYTLHVFHERATPATLESAARSIVAIGDVVTLPPLTISESGYLPIPHKNKFGKDYPPATDDGGFYPSRK